uniref:Uncharacterized protein n=1 Tax=Anguilla anguilla TaxID=7936 RepID=A0A0E9RMM7_ANGAN
MFFSKRLQPVFSNFEHSSTKCGPLLFYRCSCSCKNL